MPSRLALACVVLCLVAPSAGAKTYGGMASAGPAISGDSVVWGAEYSDGSGAVKVDGRVVTRFERAAGQAPQPVLHRRAGRGKRLSHPARVHPRRLTGHPRGQRLAWESRARFTPLVSAAGGPFTNPLGCTTGDNITTAVDGDTVVLGVMGRQPCAGVYVDGRKIDTRGESRQVRIAGPYVAWLDAPGGDRITVADRATGAVIATYPATPGRRSWRSSTSTSRATSSP